MERILLVLLCALVCALTREVSATPLTINQGRLVGRSDLEILTVVGIATVEISGEDHERPTYYFDCISNQNNGSGLQWTRRNGQQRFDVQQLHSGLPGIRMRSRGIGTGDLDVYICADDYSDDVAILNITDSNPAIMAAEETVEVVQGLTVELEVYVSGYPVPTESHITWKRPDQSVIMSSDPGVSFQEGRKRMILSNVQAVQAGLYECTVTVLDMSASVKIRLNGYVAPVILTHPSEIIDAVEWSPVTLTCSASGIPLPLIQWERESEEPLPVDHHVQPSHSEAENTTTSQLVLSMVRYEDRGRYRCVANNVHTIVAMSNYTDIRVTPALRLVDEQSQVPVEDLHFSEEESSVRLECFGSGSLKWTSSTGLNISSSDLENIHQSYDPTRDALTLVIMNFTSINTATYTCTTNLNDAHNSPLAVSILITSSNPAVIIHSRVQFVLPGNITTLMARVFASASPANSTRVNWYHEGRLIDDISEEKYTARSDGDIYQLELNSVSEKELGRYEIVVSLNGVNATDTIQVRFPEPPSANVTPSSVTVNEGEMVSLFCEAGGSGVLNVSWMMANGSPLPVGVQENGNEIMIARASSLHPGTYVCSVRNLAGTTRDDAEVTVFYSPTAVITYNQSTSTPNQPLYLAFDHGAPGPTIVCSGDGYLPPILRWVQQNGRDLPHGIFQTSQPNGDVHLQWLRPMEFTDSGSYFCKASNSNGHSSATLQVLIQILPEISSIYPFSSNIKRDTQTFTYIVPVKYTGTTLVCTASGWPAPEVVWHKDGLPLPVNDNVTSEPVAMSATVSAKLTWKRYFQSSDTGNYQCIVRKPNTVVEIASQTVYLKAENSTVTNPPVPCSVQDRSINFQVRVLGTGCINWDSEQSTQIATEFHGELLNIIQAECSCPIDESELQILGSPQCSSKVNNAVVFRGKIDTSSQIETEQLFCALSSWQQTSPLIRINSRFQAIDTNCPLESSGSEECVVPPPVLGFMETAVIIGVVIAVIVFVITLVVVIPLICRYCHKRKQRFGVTDRMSDHTYSRTDAFSSYSSRSRVGPISSEAYSTLSPGSRDSPLQFADTMALSDVHSGSNENLLSPDGFADDVKRGQPTPTANGYEIPLRSHENLVSVGLDSNGDVRATKKHTSSTSGENSSNVVSPVTATSSIPQTSQSTTTGSSRTSNVQNPQWPYYEDTFSPDSTSSFRDSPTISGRADGPGPQQTNVAAAHVQQSSRFGGSLLVPRDSTISSSSQVTRQQFMSQFQSVDNMTHLSGWESSFSEPPPPYSSRPSSEFVLDRDGDDSSMRDNGAYESANHLQHPWYQDSGPPVESRNASTSSNTSRTTTSTTERLQPYAMIQNEHIPYHSLNDQTGMAGQPTSVPATRRVSNHQRPSLPNGTSTSTLC